MAINEYSIALYVRIPKAKKRKKVNSNNEQLYKRMVKATNKSMRKGQHEEIITIRLEQE